MVALCDRLAGQHVNITTILVVLLRFTWQLARLLQWTKVVADRQHVIASSELNEILIIYDHVLYNFI